MVDTTTLFKTLCKLILFLILAVLFVMFYMKDQMTDYLMNRTTISTRFEEVKRLEYPTLTICISYGQKPSIARHLGLSLNYDILGYGISEEFLKEANAKNLSEVFEKVSYILDRDFEITYSFGFENKNQNNPKKMEVGKNHFTLNRNGSEVVLNFTVEAIQTMQYATCYKIEGSGVNAATVPFHSHFNLTQLVDKKEDRSKGIYVLLTDGNTWTGITRSVWPQFTPTKIYIPFDSSFHELKIRSKEHYFSQGVDDTKDCMTSLLSNSSCQPKCNLLSYDNFDPCVLPKESRCMLDEFFDNFEEAEKCFKPKRAMTFDVEHAIFHNHAIEQTNEPSDMVQVYLGMWSTKKEINEEIRIITESSLIGSLGGSLGMFFGFSIFTHLLYFLDKLADRMHFYQLVK